MSHLASHAPVCVTFRTSLECDLGKVSSARREMRCFLEEQGIRHEEISACELALAEACNNAIQSAPPGARDRQVEILAICTPSKIELHVTDHTEGFEWPETIGLPEDHEEHGRGLFFIQSFMDEANYFRGPHENSLVMRKMRAASPAWALPAGADTAVQELRTSLAESQLALSEMARELCFRSEALAAIRRCSPDLGRSNDLKEFAERLMNDLLHIAAAEWFIVRMFNPAGQLSMFVSSLDVRAFPDLEVLPSPDELNSVEVQSAADVRDVDFGSTRPLSEGDPLAAHFPDGSGFVHPIRMDQTLIGTLAIGSSSTDCSFSIPQREVVRTFADFLAIQLLNARLREEQISSRLLSHELEIARGIQRSLLPKSLPHLRGFGLAAHCESARQVGGDFYDLLQISESSVLLVIADVMGKGVPAALFAALLRSLVRAHPEWSCRPAELLTRINLLLFDDLSAVNMFITAQIVLLDVNRQRAVIGNAGHCPMLLATERGRQIQPVTAEGMPLGVLRDSVFEETIVPLDSTSRLILHTDGVTDARNPSGECFGEGRLRAWIEASWKAATTADALKSSLISVLKSFEGSAPLQDDRTFLIAAAEESAAGAA